jgi:hypothetical protein
MKTPPSYVDMEVALKNDVDKVNNVLAGAFMKMCIALQPREGGAPLSMEVDPDGAILTDVRDAVGNPRAQAWYGGEEITDSDATFRQYGIEDGARMTVATARMTEEVDPSLE